MRARLLVLVVCSALVSAPRAVCSQERGVKLAVGDVGIGIGDVPRLDGLRLNFRDRDLNLVRGMNVTIWTPHDEADGVVRGLAFRSASSILRATSDPSGSCPW